MMVGVMFAAMMMLSMGVLGDAEDLDFARDVRPILSDKCFACHGPDSAARKGELRIDQRAAAIGMSAIVPAKNSGPPAKSLPIVNL